MGIYLTNGYLDFAKIDSYGLTFNFLVGGRGIGKTFGALDYVRDINHKFVFLRRTQTQVDLVSSPDLMPFKAINLHYNTNVQIKKINKNISGFYNYEDDKPSGEPLGYIMALSTISNVRGFDASDVSHIIYDEFIPEAHEKPIRNEGEAFLNAYETINRNRELDGKEPVRVFALANANDLGNPIFMQLNIISIAERMARSGQTIHIDRNRSIGIFLLSDSTISEQKQSTALYQAAGDGQFAKMALKNEFKEYHTGLVKSLPLREHNIISGLGEIYFYKHKSNGTYYVSMHKTGNPEYYDASDTGIERWMHNNRRIYYAYIKGNIYFEDVLTEIIFTKYLL